MFELTESLGITIIPGEPVAEPGNGGISIDVTENREAAVTGDDATDDGDDVDIQEDDAIPRTTTIDDAIMLGDDGGVANGVPEPESG